MSENRNDVEVAPLAEQMPSLPEPLRVPIDLFAIPSDLLDGGPIMGFGDARLTGRWEGERDGDGKNEP